MNAKFTRTVSVKGHVWKTRFPFHPLFFSHERVYRRRQAVMEELSAVGEQVFDAECILNKRMRKVGYYRA